MMKASSMALQ